MSIPLRLAMALAAALCGLSGFAVGQERRDLFRTEDNKTLFSVRRPMDDPSSKTWVLYNAKGRFAVPEGDRVPLLDEKSNPLVGTSVTVLVVPNKNKKVSLDGVGILFRRDADKSCKLLDTCGKVIELGLDGPLDIKDPSVSPLPPPAREREPDEVTSQKIKRDALENPATINKAVELLLGSGSGRALLSGIDFQFKTFEGEDGDAS